MLSLEIAVICQFFIFTFSWGPYKIGHTQDGPKSYRGGILGLGAIIDVINITDIFAALARGLQAKMADRHSERRQQYAQPRQQGYYGMNDNEGPYYPNHSRAPLYPGQQEQEGGRIPRY